MCIQQCQQRVALRRSVDPYFFSSSTPSHIGIVFPEPSHGQNVVQVVLFWRINLCLPRSNSLLHFDIQNICHIRMEKWNASAQCLLPADMHDRWPHVCRVKITFIIQSTNVFVSTTTNSMKCLFNWIPLRIHIRSEMPHLIVGPPVESLD